MKKQIFIAVLGLFIAKNSFAQTPAQYLKAAKEATELRNYAAAAEYYKTVLEEETYRENNEILYSCGETYRLSNAPKQAIIYYNRVKNSDLFPDFNRNIGLIYKQLGDFAKAKTYFDKIQNPSDDVLREAKGCELTGLKDELLMWKIEPIKNKQLNSEAADYATAMRNDVLVFTSNRTEIALPTGELQHLSGIYSYNKGKNSPVLLPKDGKTYQYAYLFDTNIYVAVCDDYGKKCKLEMSDASEGLAKLKLAPLAADFEWGNATMPFVTTEDDKTVLYFASDRIGGKGGMDIWKTSFDAVKKQWIAPENLTINTIGDEIAPFVDATNTLYYSSNGKASLGGYDVFSTSKMGETQHLPEPVNSSYDDYFFFKTDSVAYISSTRNPQLKKGENGLCCADIYRLTSTKIPPKIPTLPDTPPIAATKPVPLAATETPKVPDVTTPPTVSVPPSNPQTPPNSPAKPQMPPIIFTEAITLYFHNDEPDPDTRATTTTRNYEQTYSRYVVMKPIYKKGYTQGISGNLRIAAEQHIDDFFDQNITANYLRLESFTRDLQTTLANGQRVTIDLRGYCSPRASSDYNVRLSKRRVSCLKNYFHRFQQGVLSSYLKNGQLILNELPLGESTAPANISDRYNDLRGSVYSPEAAQERRVEIVQVKVE